MESAGVAGAALRNSGSLLDAGSWRGGTREFCTGGVDSEIAGCELEVTLGSSLGGVISFIVNLSNFFSGTIPTVFAAPTVLLNCRRRCICWP